MKRIPGLKAKVEPNPKYGTPRVIYDIETSASKQSPQKIAESILKRIARNLKIKPDLSQLKFDKVKETILGSHVLYQQHHEGKPISGAWIRVDIDRNGRVYNILSELVPEPVMKETRKTEAALEAVVSRQLTAREARERALEAASAGTAAAEVVDSELCYYQGDGAPVLSWKVTVKTRQRKSRGRPARPAEWRMYLDARTGAILEKRNLLRFVNGRGRVFDPNPVVVLNDTKLNNKSRVPEKAYSEVTLRERPRTSEPR